MSLEDASAENPNPIGGDKPPAEADQTTPRTSGAATSNPYGAGYGFEQGSCCDDRGHSHDQASTSEDLGQQTGPSRSRAGLSLPSMKKGRGKKVANDDEAAPATRSFVSRRRFIQGVAVAGTLGYGVVRGAKPVEKSRVESQLASQSASTNTGGDAASSAGTRIQTGVPAPEANLSGYALDDSFILNAAPVDQRVLVLIELQGGNDGPSTVVPYGAGAYYDLRPNLAIPGEEVLPIDDEVGLSPALARLHQRQLVTVEGVGPVDGVLSHFEMVERWEQGDMRGSGGQRSGLLARISDAIDAGAPITGLSVAGHTPRFNAATSGTLALTNLNQLRVLTEDEWIYPRYRSAVRGFGGGPMSTTITDSWDKLFDVGDSLNTDIGELDRESSMIKDGGRLGQQLAMAAELIKADVGVRVIHADHGGFDTHDGHRGRHINLMEQFDAAVDGFLQSIIDAGLGDRVLVATTSEFGRRVSENGSGLDHGAASTMLAFGPVKAGRNGDPSPLSDLDGNGNLRTTIAFDRYLATLAQSWMGVEAASILPDSPEPLDIF